MMKILLINITTIEDIKEMNKIIWNLLKVFLH